MAVADPHMIYPCSIQTDQISICTGVPSAVPLTEELQAGTAQPKDDADENLLVVLFDHGHCCVRVLAHCTGKSHPHRKLPIGTSLRIECLPSIDHRPAFKLILGFY